MIADLDWREWAARHFEPRPRRYPTPGALARALDPRTGTSRPLDLIDDELRRLIDGPGDYNALMIFMPPQEGKSQKCSRWLPEWVLGHDPSKRIAIVSYEQEMATRWGRQIKRDLGHANRRAMDVRVLRDSSAAGRWDTPEGGGVYCVGVGGPLTGRPVDLLIIDDPVKDRSWAESEAYRRAAWDWWENVALTRLAPQSHVVLIMTRWHQDDLAGRLLDRPGPLNWRVLNMPAIAEPPGRHGPDPLGRDPGEEFPSVRARPPGYFTHLRATMSSYVFSAIYQQNPSAAEGNFFRRAAFRYWRPAAVSSTTGYPGGEWMGAGLDLEGRRADLNDPATWRFATVDVAASTRTAADYTVVAVWAIDREGNLILLDRARAQVEMGDHFAMVKPLRDRWHFDICYVERQFYSQTLVADARANGIPVAEVRADTDKITRAIPAAGRVHAGKVWFPADAPWLDEWCDELAAFPAGTNDDQVDTLSYAARIAAAHWLPPPPPERPKPRLAPELERIEQAFDAATGNGHGQVDIMNMPLG